MRIFGILIGIWIAVNTSCSAQEGKPYIRELDPNSPVIIFLHGVLGDSKSTWLKGKAYWPDLLKQDNAFSGASVYVHEYKTELFGQSRSDLSINELADELKARLDGDGVMQHRQLIFITHSMGGLVVRALMLKFSDVVNKVRFIFFLSTPTTGAAIGYWASLVSSNPQFREVKIMVSTDYLANMQRDWVDRGFAITVPSYCAYEKEDTRYGFVHVLVVDQTSAAALCNKVLLPVEANHEDIAKPADRSALQYTAFRTYFKKEMLTSNINNELLISKLALVDRGYAYLTKKDYVRAIADFSEAIRLDPEYVPALKNRGAVYLNTGDYDGAIKDYNKAILLEPEYAEHFYNRGIAYLGKNDHEQAIRDFTKAIELNFYNRALALSYRGRAYLAKNDHDLGMRDLKDAMDLDPVPALKNRGAFYLDTGDYAHAIDDYKEATRLEPENGENFYNLGAAYLDKEEYDQAIAKLTEAIRLNFYDKALALYKRGYARQRKGDNCGQADMEAAIAIDPNVGK